MSESRALYDHFTPIFLRTAGETFQAGLLKVDGREDPRASNVALARRAGVRSGDRVLDVGCGVGGPARHVASAIDGVRIAGLTNSPVQHELGNLRCVEEGLDDRVRLHLGDFHAMPFDDDVFDVVMFYECTGYSADPETLFAEVRRVLRPGGTVYIKDVFVEERELAPAEREVQEAFDRNWALAASPKRSETEAVLATLGFTVVRSQRFGDEMGGAWYIGSMFDVGDGGVRLNAFGERFIHHMEGLPSYFGEVIARSSGSPTDAQV